MKNELPESRRGKASSLHGLVRDRKVQAALIILLIAGVLVLRRNSDGQHGGAGGGNGREVAPVARGYGTSESSHIKERPAKVDVESEVGYNRNGTINDLENTYSLFSEEGKVTSHALDLAGLDTEDIPVIEKIMAETRESLSKLCLRNSRLNEKETDVEKGIHVYEVRSFARDGDAVMIRMNEKFESAFGKQAATFLSKGIHPWQYFGNFGRYDMTVRIEPNTVLRQIRGDQRVTVTFVDPRTGQNRGTGGFQSLDELRNYMGSFVEEVTKEGF